MFLANLFDFFAMEPAIRSLPAAIPAPRPIREGFEFHNVNSPIRRSARLVVETFNFRLYPQEK